MCIEDLINSFLLSRHRALERWAETRLRKGRSPPGRCLAGTGPWASPDTPELTGQPLVPGKHKGETGALSKRPPTGHPESRLRSAPAPTLTMGRKRRLLGESGEAAGLALCQQLRRPRVPAATGLHSLPAHPPLGAPVPCRAGPGSHTRPTTQQAPSSPATAPEARPQGEGGAEGPVPAPRGLRDRGPDPTACAAHSPKQTTASCARAPGAPSGPATARSSMPAPAACRPAFCPRPGSR